MKLSFFMLLLDAFPSHIIGYAHHGFIFLISSIIQVKQPSPALPLFLQEHCYKIGGSGRQSRCHYTGQIR